MKCIKNFFKKWMNGKKTTLIISCEVARNNVENNKEENKK